MSKCTHFTKLKHLIFLNEGSSNYQKTDQYMGSFLTITAVFLRRNGIKSFDRRKSQEASLPEETFPPRLIFFFNDRLAAQLMARTSRRSRTSPERRKGAPVMGRMLVAIVDDDQDDPVT
jgi:hypothetical protein